MIKILRNEQGNCINFEGSSNPTYWNACLSGEVDSQDSNAVNVVNDVITSETGVTEYEFYKIPYTEFVDRDGNGFADAQEAADYITAQANVVGLGGGGTDLTDVSVCFKLDDTSTSIMLDNGYSYGVNTIKAVSSGDGLITIQSELGSIIHFTKLNHTSVCDADGVSVSGGLNDVINYLNELFTVGAFQSVVIADPHSTLVADVGGVLTTGGLVGSAINPSGNDIGAGVSAHYNKSGYKSTETIDQAGEYFTFNMRNEGIFGACLVLNDIADAQGNLTYADPTKFCDGVTNTGNMGIQWGMFFHPSPDGPWTYYGAQTGTIYGSGWNGADAFRYSNSGANWLAGNAEEFRIGIDANSFISMEYYDNDNSAWVVVSRTNYPVGNGVKFHLGIKFCDSTVRLVDNPKVHLLEVDDTPTSIGDTDITLLGDAIGTLNDGIATASGSNYDNGFITNEGLDASGEYFEFEVNLGSDHTVCLVDADTHSVSTIAADDSIDLIDDYAYFGQPINSLGAVTLNQHNWSGISAVEGNRFAATHFRIGFNNQGELTVWSSTDGSNFIVSKYLSSASISGDYRLMYIGRDAGATFESLSKGQLTQAPIMYFRYIESPDGVYNYPLFATAEEAEYYDEITNGLTAGTGSSHTHTYADDPTNTTWYMSEATHDASTYQHNSAPDGTETFSGNAVTYTEITSLVDADLTPVQFSANDITQEEGTAVNLQVTPAGASWSTSVVITPSGSGLVYDGYSVIQGTLADVGSDTTYTISVTRANSYGSTTGTMTITATDVAPVQTNDTAWTKAIDFSGSSEYLKHNSGNATASKMPLGLSSGTYIAKNSNPLYTANSSSSRPWAQTIVFKADGNNSLQCIWNNGEGFYSSSDNFGLEIDANNTLWFYYGQGSSTSANYNKCYVQIGIDTSKWYGVYIAHKGGRLSGNDATKANLGECFDIRVMSSADSFTSISPNRSGANSGGNWQVTGRRMDKSVNGMYTIGATASYQKPFYGKVASSVITTLKNNSLAPVEAEIKTMITDPIKWENDYKQGTTFRAADSSSTASVPSVPSVAYQYATQIHLMGDSIGIYPYSNNDAYPDIFNNLRWYTSTKMIMQNMVSNDIETVSINGLT